MNKQHREERREGRRQRRRQRDEDMDEDDDNSSRNSSVSSSTRSNTSGTDDEARERDEHKCQANRRQRVLYNDLLHERCFGKMDFD